MSQESRWVRLNVDWESSAWLEELPWAIRAVWPVFLCHVKLHGNNRGRCKAISVKAFARMHDIPAEIVSEFFDAAVIHGALEEVEGQWIVTGWGEYQSPDAARVRKHREPAEPPTTSPEPTPENHPEKEPFVTDKLETSVTNATCSDSCHATLTETETDLLKTENIATEPLPSDSSGDEPSGLTSDQVEEARRRAFWMESGKSNDPVLRALCKACFNIPKFKAVVPPSLATVEKVVARLRAMAPHDAAILAEIENFDLYWSSQVTITGKGQWWLSIGKWCDKHAGAWALAKKRGGLMAVNGGKQIEPPTEDELRAKEAMVCR